MMVVHVCEPGVSKGLDNLAFPSVSVRPGEYLFLPCLMHLRLFADSDRSRSYNHGFVRRMSRLCSWINMHRGCGIFFHQASRPQLHSAGATAAVVVSFGRGWSNVDVIYGMFRVEWHDRDVWYKLDTITWQWYVVFFEWSETTEMYCMLLMD